MAQGTRHYILLKGAALSSPLLNPKSTTNEKRWQKAFSTICCSRALSFPLLKPTNEKVVIIDLLEPHPCFPEIYQSSLTQLVKLKDLNQLHKFGGVEGLASVLKTNLDNGIHGDMMRIFCEEMKRLDRTLTKCHNIFTWIWHQGKWFERRMIGSHAATWNSSIEKWEK